MVENKAGNKLCMQLINYLQRWNYLKAQHRDIIYATSNNDISKYWNPNYITDHKQN